MTKYCVKFEVKQIGHAEPTQAVESGYDFKHGTGGATVYVDADTIEDALVAARHVLTTLVAEQDP